MIESFYFNNYPNEIQIIRLFWRDGRLAKSKLDKIKDKIDNLK